MFKKVLSGVLATILLVSACGIGAAAEGEDASTPESSTAGYVAPETIGPAVEDLTVVKHQNVRRPTLDNELFHVVADNVVLDLKKGETIYVIVDATDDLDDPEEMTPEALTTANNATLGLTVSGPNNWTMKFGRADLLLAEGASQENYVSAKQGGATGKGYKFYYSALTWAKGEPFHTPEQIVSGMIGEMVWDADGNTSIPGTAMWRAPAPYEDDFAYVQSSSATAPSRLQIDGTWVVIYPVIALTVPNDGEYTINLHASGQRHDYSVGIALLTDGDGTIVREGAPEPEPEPSEPESSAPVASTPETSTPAASTPETSAPTASTPAAGNTSTASAPESSEQTTDTGADAEGFPVWGIVLIVVGAVVVLGGAGAAVFFLVIKKKKA